MQEWSYYMSQIWNALIVGVLLMIAIRLRGIADTINKNRS